MRDEPTTGAVVAIDTGGTFTDLSARGPDGRRHRLKVPSTPDDPARAVRDALAALSSISDEPSAAPISEVRHGTTVATNALLERAGARVVLVTTAGFEDTLRLRRQNRPDLYALHPVLPAPLVGSDGCVGVGGRLGPGGVEWAPLPDLAAWLDEHRAVLESADVFAVCLLHAYADGAHEQCVGEALAGAFPDTPVYLSHALCPVFREYERTSTVVVNAFVAPVMAGYLARLEAAIAPSRLLVMASGGGLVSAARAAAEPVHTVLSGPAGGVRGAWQAGRRVGRSALLTLDMGGTSTDVSLVTGALAPEDDGAIAEHPLRVSLLPIETVGAGGGSIAYVDDGGALRVGPRSAGAVPGPACYGRGGPDAEATVTDAHVVLGRLPDLLGGAMRLDREAARAAIGRLAARLDAELEDTAAAVLAVAEANMARACKRVSMERGVDPRGLTLVAFGGAGGLHACALADGLGCADVLFPAEPGVLSAEGIVDAPLESAVTATLVALEPDWPAIDPPARWAALRNEAADQLRREIGDGPAQMDWLTFADCRYAGQTFTLPVPIESAAELDPVALRAAFDARHVERFGYRLSSERSAELVALRVYVTCRSPDRSDDAAEPEAPAVVERYEGPRAVATYSATLWLPDGWFGERLSTGDILCRRAAAACRDDEAGRVLGLALEVHRQRLAAIAEEMGATLMRAAFSANIKERRDFSCAVFDADGRMLAQAAHIPVHLGSTPLSVAAAIEAVPMRPSVDVILNDPFAGGTHLPDVTIVTPVFRGGEAAPVFYVANRAHHADVGGISPGSLPAPRDADGRPRRLRIDDEGHRLPPTPLDDAVRDAFAAASRTPDERRGDLRAQEAANRLGARRLIELLADLGDARAHTLNGALLDYAERRMRALARALPDGVYRFEDALDDDGIGDTPIPVPVEVTVLDDRIAVDFTAAPNEVPTSMNAVRPIAVSAVFYVFRCLAGAQMPENAGLMRPIEVRTRPGSIIDAAPPAAVSAGNVETSQRLVDALYGALAAAEPRIPAASSGTMNNVLFGGRDPRRGADRPFVHYETLGGGAGASAAGPGADAVHTHMTNTLNTPVEAFEHAFPVRILRYSVRPVAPLIGGVHRGGAGIVRAYQFDAPAEVTLISERRRIAPYGLGGASAGECGHNRLIRAGGAITELPGKCTVEVEPGDVLVIETPGGGAAPVEPADQTGRSPIPSM